MQQVQEVDCWKVQTFDGSSFDELHKCFTYLYADLRKFFLYTISLLIWFQLNRW